jgi:dTMP kinase
VKRGSLLAFEGLDGSGKSTQIERLAARLRSAGCTVVTTREPTDGAVGRRIRGRAASGRMPPPDEELRWFVEDRREHVETLIAPALAAGSVVLTDRYTLSSVAYQGARGLDWRAILEEGERQFPLPDLALLLEIDPGEGLGRVRERGRHLEPAFEDEAYLARVAAIFAAIDRPYVARLDARGTPDAVEAAVLETVRARLGLG